MTISQRRARLRRRLAAAELDAMLVTDLVNVRYLSGFTGSNAALLIRVDDDTPVLATDGRYVTQAAQQSPDAEVVIERACAPHLAAAAAARGVRRLGFESHVVTVDGHALLAKAAGDVELVRAAGAVEALREVKDAGEIALLRLACEAADAALADLVGGGWAAAGTHREGGRPRPRVADARPRRRRGVLRDDRRGGRRTRRSRTIARPTPCSPRATSSRSTSARWSPATTRT